MSLWASRACDGGPAANDKSSVKDEMRKRHAYIHMVMASAALSNAVQMSWGNSFSAPALGRALCYNIVVISFSRIRTT